MRPSPGLRVNVSQRAGRSSGAESVLALEHLRLLLTLLLHLDHPRPVHTQALPVALGHQAHILVLQDHLDPPHPPAHIQVQLPLQTLILVPVDPYLRHHPTHTVVPQVHPLTPVLLLDRHPLPRAVTQAQVKRRRPAIRVRKDQWGRTLILIPMEPRSAPPSPPDH